MKELECWWNVPDWGFSVCLPPRCGSSSIIHYLYSNGLTCYRPIIENKITGDVRDDMQRRIMVVRDPVARFTSLWKSKCLNGEKLWVDDEIAVLDNMSPEGLIAFIEHDQSGDAHWATLTEIEAGYSTEVILASNMNKVLGVEKNPRLNYTGDNEVTLDPEVEVRVRAFYKDDYGLL